MVRNYLPRLVYYILAPIALAFVVGGLWLTWQAQQSNYKTGKGIEQILRAVGQGRLMRLTPNTDARLALGDLILTLEQRGRDTTVIMSGVDPARDNAKALVNAWGGQTRLYLYPAALALRVESEMDAVACRRVSTFFTKDAAALGVRRLDVRLDQTTGLWRLVFDAAKQGDQAYLAQAIQAACGLGEGKTVSVTFALR